jgi:hypothetical protein
VHYAKKKCVASVKYHATLVFNGFVQIVLNCVFAHANVGMVFVIDAKKCKVSAMVAKKTAHAMLRSVQNKSRHIS